MTRQTFILSDCEFSECGGKFYALLTASPTKEHHYIVRTEQRQHAHNPQVSPQNQNVYKLPLSMFREPAAVRCPRSGDKVRGGHESCGATASVNIVGSLAAKDPYALTSVENTINQYNLESQFNRHENGYKEACNYLRTLPEGRLKTDETDTIKIPKALWRTLWLEFLGILRNPHSYKNLFIHHLHGAVRARLPEVEFRFVRLVSKYGLDRVEAIMQNYRFSFLGYVDWLAGFYDILNEGVAQPSLFERLLCTIFARPGAVKTELFRYAENEGLCLFSDSSFCLQTSPKLTSVGMNISHDVFAVVHLQTGRWPASKDTFHHDTPKLEGRVRIIGGDQTQRLMFNRLTTSQTREAMFGRSPNVEDYLETVWNPPARRDLMNITPIQTLNDNYIWTIQDDNHAACIDPSDVTSVLKFLVRNHLMLAQMWITRPHHDHIDSVKTLKNSFMESLVYGEADIEAATHTVKVDTQFPFGDDLVTVWTTPGHTSRHVSYLLENLNGLYVLCGDTLFSAGCGRVFTRTIEELYGSFQRFNQLPEGTLFYSAYEYATANLRFAEFIEPENPDIQAALRAAEHTSTLPVTLAHERRINPFLRVDFPKVREQVEELAGRGLNSDLEVFAALRELKNRFQAV